MLKALEPLLPSSPAYEMLKITEEVEFEDYLRKHPAEFSWKSVAEVLYRCGEETLLNQLFAYLKSPEGKMYFACLSMQAFYNNSLMLMLEYSDPTKWARKHVHT